MRVNTTFWNFVFGIDCSPFLCNFEKWAQKRHMCCSLTKQCTCAVFLPTVFQPVPSLLPLFLLLIFYFLKRKASILLALIFVNNRLKINFFKSNLSIFSQPSFTHVVFLFFEQYFIFFYNYLFLLTFFFYFSYFY